MIFLAKAEPDHASLLASISRRAFDTDVLVGGGSPGGPPDYDSPEWHGDMIARGHVGLIVHDGTVIGGYLLFPHRPDPRIMYIGRIFIDPAWHGRGYGLEAMRLIEQDHGLVTEWRLETPDWNVRTQNFYKKLGYHEVGRRDGSVFFQKTVVT